MGRKRSGKAANTARRQLLDKGIATLALGAVLLLASLFLGNSPALRAVATGLRVAGPLALVLGAVLIGLHLVARRTPKPEAPAKKDPVWTAWAPPDLALGDDHPLAADAEPEPPFEAAEDVARTPATQWCPQVLEDIEWRRFEAVCEQLFGQAGFETRAQSHGADGGVDIWLHSRHAQGPAAIVQCKHWLGKQVGVKELREFYGVMASHQLKRGTYATSSTFTVEAALFAKENGINAMDRERLLSLIARRTPEQQRELLATAYEGEYWRPTCASCGVKMVQREKKKDRMSFWGCAQYPKCTSTLRIRQAA